MAKKIDFKEMRKRTSKAAKGMSEKDRAHEEKEENIRQQSATFPLSDIKDRPGGDTRSLRLEHIVSLAESISALGLLEPIVIDKNGFLLAGGHRLAACRLLNATAKKKTKLLEEMRESDPRSVTEELEERLEELNWSRSKEELRLLPVRVMDFDASKDADLALAVEAAENTQRKDYTAKEVFRIYQKLLNAGYTDKPGRPSKNEKAAKPAVAMVIGRSLKTVNRMLQKQLQENEQNQSLLELEKAITKIEGAITHFERAAKGFDSPELLEALSKKLNQKLKVTLRQTRKSLQEKK